MPYRAQLVIRTSDPDSAALIDEIRNIANDSERTISEVACEYLALGKASKEEGLMTLEQFQEEYQSEVDAKDDGDENKKSSKKSKGSNASKKGKGKAKSQKSANDSDDSDELEDETDGDNNGKSTSDSDNQKGNENNQFSFNDLLGQNGEASPRDFSRQAAHERRRKIVEDNHKFVEDVVELYETEGTEAAAKTLAERFKDCTPIEGGALRKILRIRLTAADTEEIFAAAANLNDYQTYKTRLLFGEDAL